MYGAVLISRISEIHDTMPIEVDIAYSKVLNDWNAAAWAPYLDRVAPGSYCLPRRRREREGARALCGDGNASCLVPDAYGEKPYHLAEWEPLWEAANALKIPITMHVGGTRLPMAAYAGMRPYKGLGFVGWYNQCVGWARRWDG